MGEYRLIDMIDNLQAVSVGILTRCTQRRTPLFNFSFQPCFKPGGRLRLILDDDGAKLLSLFNHGGVHQGSL